MKSIWTWIIIGLIVIGGGYYWMKGAPAPVAPTGQTVSLNNQGGPDANAPQPEAQPTPVAISYDGTNFSPAEVTVKKGGTVTFTSTVSTMWVASGPHPAHTGYDGTDRAAHCTAGYAGAVPFDQCASGSSYSFTFGTIGTWGFHDHKNSSAHGKITVVE
jgi:plastocyanin